jgi:hypothetical protein
VQVHGAGEGRHPKLLGRIMHTTIHAISRIASCVLAGVVLGSNSDSFSEVVNDLDEIAHHHLHSYGMYNTVNLNTGLGSLSLPIGHVSGGPWHTVFTEMLHNKIIALKTIQRISH